MSTYRRTTNPKEFPIEIVMLFEKASYGPVRFPIEGKGYPSKAKAFGAKMALARWRAQMLRSDETPTGYASMLNSIQFNDPVNGKDGWFFTIGPRSSPTIDLAKEVIGDIDYGQVEAFWQQFN